MAIIGNVYKLEMKFKNKNIDVVFKYLKDALDVNSDVHKRIFSLKDGSFDKVYLSDEVFAYEQVTYTQERAKCFIESHRKYVDFQLILDGTEQMEYIDIDKLEVDCAYDIDKDLIAYMMATNTSKFLLEKADLAIFYPEDGHIGLSKYKEASRIYKVVVKVPVELLM